MDRSVGRLRSAADSRSAASKSSTVITSCTSARTSVSTLRSSLVSNPSVTACSSCCAGSSAVIAPDFSAFASLRSTGSAAMTRGSTRSRKPIEWPGPSPL